jgi:hypothetical protein
MSVAVKPVRNDGTTFRQVDRQNLALKESNVPQHFTDRIDDMRYIEITCRYFMKHGREQEEVFLTDQRDFEIGSRRFSNSRAAYRPPKPPPRMRKRFFFKDV